MEKREPSCAGFVKVSWYQARGRTVWRFVKKLKIKLPHEQAIPLLGL